MTDSTPLSSPVIVALDVAGQDDALALADLLDPRTVRVKVGKQLFTAEGPGVVRALHDRGFDVFLDLKFHDIPNTVAAAVAAAADLGVWMVNVHASGGRRMLMAAREALGNGSGRPLLTAVTVLTSMTEADLYEVGIARAPLDHVRHLALLAQDSGLDGVVCSAQEADMLRTACGLDFLLVTPGIRPKGDDAGDQRRVVTPPEALALGATHLVIGRPITASSDPQQAVNAILSSLSPKTL